MHTVKWFEVLLYNSHNLTSVICLHTVCSIWPIDRTLSGATTPGQGGPEAKAMKGYSTFPKSPRMEPCHQIVYCHIQDTLSSLQRCIRCILQPQVTGLMQFRVISRTPHFLGRRGGSWLSTERTKNDPDRLFLKFLWPTYILTFLISICTKNYSICYISYLFYNKQVLDELLLTLDQQQKVQLGKTTQSHHQLPQYWYLTGNTEWWMLIRFIED